MTKAIKISVEHAYEYVRRDSEQASEINRQLSLAGIAVIWIFKSEPGNVVTIIPKQLLAAGILILLGLASDLTQYLVNWKKWRTVTRQHEEAGVDPFNAPGDINEWGLRLFKVKFVFTLLAYSFILWFLIYRIAL